MKKQTKLFSLFLLSVAIIAVAYIYIEYGNFFGNNYNFTSEPNRPDHWAKPIQAEHLPNLYKVSGQLYRGAQPSEEGMAQLKQMGIKTVINLRTFHSDRDEIGDTDLAYERIRSQPWHPEDEDVIKFLQIVTDPNRTPAFVHCQRGSDRTGTMCALYRILVHDWTKDEAIAEMTKGGFGFYQGWENLVEYIEELDLEDIKSRAGLN